ncbi:MAG: hypothetical protein ACT4PV_00525 [Planctomycetaceae bacterium]
MTIRCLAVLAALAAAAVAQEDPREKLRRQMEEISKLMRESERLLLEITRVDRVQERQAEVARKLEALLKDPPETGGAAAEKRDAERQALERQQEELRRQLEELLGGQQEKGEKLVKSLEELLRSLPRGGRGQGSGDPPRGKERPRDGGDRRPEDREELKQNDPNEPRDEREKSNPEGRRPKDETASPDRMRQIEAWLARLPPEEQERLRRGDLSHVPAPYRTMIEAYTKARAKREADEADSPR